MSNRRVVNSQRDVNKMSDGVSRRSIGINISSGIICYVVYRPSDVRLCPV